MTSPCSTAANHLPPDEWAVLLTSSPRSRKRKRFRRSGEPGGNLSAPWPGRLSPALSHRVAPKARPMVNSAKCGRRGPDFASGQSGPPARSALRPLQALQDGAAHDPVLVVLGEEIERFGK